MIGEMQKWISLELVWCTQSSIIEISCPLLGCAAVLPRLPQCKALSINALHGKMKQAARAATLTAFAEARCGK